MQRAGCSEDVAGFETEGVATEHRVVGRAAGDGGRQRVGPDAAPAIVLGQTQASPTPADAVIVITKPPGEPPLEGLVFAGDPFSVTAAVEDGQGQVLTSFDGSVAIALGLMPMGATLGGTLTVTAKGGVAVFSGLTVSQAGTGYTIKVSAAGAESTAVPFEADVDQIISLPESPPGPSVLAAQTVRKRGSLGEITLKFDQPMDAGAVTNLLNYALFDAGADRVFGNRGNRRLRLKRAKYEAGSDSVTLVLKKPEGLKQSLCLILNSQPATGLRNATGQFLGGFGNWAPQVNEMLFLGKRPGKVKESFLQGDSAYIASLANPEEAPWSSTCCALICRWDRSSNRILSRPPTLSDSLLPIPRFDWRVDP